MFDSCSKNEDCQSGYCTQWGPIMCELSTDPNADCVPIINYACSEPWYLAPF